MSVRISVNQDADEGPARHFVFKQLPFFPCPIHPRHLAMKGYTQNIDFICLSVTEIQMFKFVPSIVASKLLRCTLYHISLVLNYYIFDDAFFHSMQRFIISLQVTESHDDFSLVLCLVFELRI